MLDILLADKACPENYRIKPEEPKFKVGDWVCFNNKVMKVTDGTSPIGLIALNNDGNAYMSKDLSLWQPKPGEWCWFYQSKREIPILGNLKYFSDKDGFCAYSTPKASISVKYFKHCEPFLGQLPTNLQDIK